MFALSHADLGLKILDCAGGPASFNARATRERSAVVSIDPLYAFDAAAIHERINATRETMLEQTRANRQQFVWDTIRSLDELLRLRSEAMQEFLEDFELGKRQGRYVVGELPWLPFPDQSFELAVCSHFLFLYSEHLSKDFHRASIVELCRVSSEVRIFPLLALDGRLSPYVEGVARQLDGSFEISVETTAYEFQRGGNQMVRIRPIPK